MDFIPFSKLANFHPKQRQATLTRRKFQFPLYGGSRGPGKSYWLRWDTILDLMEMSEVLGIKRPVGVLFCEDYPTLRDRQISKIAVEFPDWMGVLKDSKEFGLAYHLAERFGGGVMQLRNLEDPHKYRSAEFARISIDEITRNKVEVFNILKGSLRWPGVPQPRMAAATNPGGIGHLWVKSYWIDCTYPPELEKDRGKFAFIPALPDDNPHLEPDYWEMLETLPPDLARAWRWGDWDVFEGQFFHELRKNIHGYRGETPPGWTFRFLDYGESAPSAVYWATVDFDGHVWAHRELYGPGYIYSALAKKMKEMTVEPIRYTAAPPDIWAKSKGTGVVGAKVLQESGIPLRKADNNRIEGWRHLREFLKTEDGGPFLHIHIDSCPNFWRTVPSLIYDETHSEDMDSDGEDHAADAFRYGLRTRPRPDVKPKEKPHPLSAEGILQKMREEQSE